MNAFSLIEALIVITITAILVAISYPHYQHYLIRARRKQAQITLIDLATQLEEYHVLKETYSANGSQILAPKLLNNNSYHFRIDQANEHNFLISAVPLGLQKQADACGILSIDSQGKKTVSGSQTAEQCWEN